MVHQIPNYKTYMRKHGAKHCLWSLKWSCWDLFGLVFKLQSEVLQDWGPGVVLVLDSEVKVS